MNGGGVVADIWDPATRGLATTIFSTMIFFGPVLGAVIGGLCVHDRVRLKTDSAHGLLQDHSKLPGLSLGILGHRHLRWLLNATRHLRPTRNARTYAPSPEGTVARCPDSYRD